MIVKEQKRQERSDKEGEKEEAWCEVARVNGSGSSTWWFDTETGVKGGREERRKKDQANRKRVVRVGEEEVAWKLKRKAHGGEEERREGEIKGKGEGRKRQQCTGKDG